jgi:hypothetical protein
MLFGQVLASVEQQRELLDAVETNKPLPKLLLLLL